MKIFYDVDTQIDFICTDGALHVPGAETLLENFKKLHKHALEEKIQVFGSVDRHFEKDAELTRNGGPFPDHCMNATRGVLKIAETTHPHGVFVPNPIRTMWNLRQYEQFVRSHNAIFFEKQHYDVTTNYEFNTMMNIVKPTEVIMFGVATDYCVAAAALAFRKLGAEVKVVEDAIKGVVKETTEAKIKEMEAAGVKFITTKEVIGEE